MSVPSGGQHAPSNAEPAPDVEISDFNERGTVLAVRPYCHTSHYWQVYFDTNKLIASTFGAAGFPPPFTVEREEQVQFDRPGTPPTRTTKAKTAG